MSDDRENFSVGGYIQDRDMNNDGIADIHQPGTESYAAHHAGDGTHERGWRDMESHLTATMDTSSSRKADAEHRRRIDASNDVLASKERFDEANPNKALDPGKKSAPGNSYSDALHEMDIRRLRNGKRRKSKVTDEISRTRPVKSDSKDGMVLAEEAMKGLIAGYKHHQNRVAERAKERQEKEADQLVLRAAEEKDRQAEQRELRDIVLNGRDPSGPEGPGGAGPSGGDGPSGGPDGRGPQDPKSQDRAAANGPAMPIAASSRTSEQKSSESVEAESTEAPVSAENANRTATAGLALSAVNPALGIVATAAKSRHDQAQAGQEHKLHGAVRSKGPKDSVRAEGGQQPHKPARTTVQAKRSLQISGPTSGNVIDLQSRRPHPGGVREQAEAMGRGSGRIVTSKGPTMSVVRSRVAGVGHSIVKHIENSASARDVNIAVSYEASRRATSNGR